MAVPGRPTAMAAWVVRVLGRLDADGFREWCPVSVRDFHRLAWAAAPAEESAARRQQELQRQVLHQKRQLDVRHPIGPPEAVQVVAIAKVVDRELAPQVLVPHPLERGRSAAMVRRVAEWEAQPAARRAQMRRPPELQ